jgi:SPP1 gp7 family putative phage head morphogenesis protein
MRNAISHLACCGIDAIDAVFKSGYGIEIQKAPLDPLDPDDFLRIVSQLARAMEAATSGAEGVALRAALQALDVDWPTMNVAGRDRVIDAVRAALAPVPERVMPTITETFEIRGGQTMAAARESAIRRFGLEIGTSLSQRDLDAEKYIRASYSNMITNAYGERVDALASMARDIVSNGLEQGLGRDDIANDLNRALGDRLMRGRSYWQVVATSFMNTARTASNLNAFADAGITLYRFEAVMDEATTDQCRFYHDQVFSVGAAINTMNAQMRATSIEGLQNTNPWVRVGRDSDGGQYMYVERDGERTRIADIESSGVGTQEAGTYTNAKSSTALEGMGVPYPPLHALCRSTIVPAGPGF